MKSPFYIGQRVLCIDDSESYFLKEGKEYIIQGLVISNCRCKNLLVNIGKLRKNYFISGSYCDICKKEFEENDPLDEYFAASRFVPIEEAFLTISYTKIREEVLVGAN